jgi:hypothetical protein
MLARQFFEEQGGLPFRSAVAKLRNQDADVLAVEAHRTHSSVLRDDPGDVYTPGQVW